MGNFTYSNIGIELESKEDAQKVYEAMKVADKTIEAKYKKASTSIYDIEDPEGGKAVYLKVSSGRERNCYWQVERIIEILQSLNISLLELNADMYSSIDSFYFDSTEDLMDFDVPQE